jgi:uncharacterized membrane protein
MILLIVGIIAFLGIHMLPSFTHVREGLIGRLGEAGYKVVFSLLSIATFVLLVWAFAKAPVIQIWSPPPWTRWVAIVLMLPAFIFLVAAYVPGRIKATVKHPFLVAIKTWALAHLIANGDLASILLFGSFLAYAVYDRITERPHCRGFRRGVLRGVPGLASPAPDWAGSPASLSADYDFFAVQKALIFCHKRLVL